MSKVFGRLDVQPILAQHRSFHYRQSLHPDIMQQSLPPNSSHNHHQSYMDPTDSSRRSHRPSLAEFRHPGFTDPSQSSYDPNPPQSYDQQVDPNGLTSAGSSRRGTKRRKDSALAEAETSSRRGTQPGIGQGSNVVQGHIGSDDMRNGLMVGPGAGVNPEDIHPQVSLFLSSSRMAVRF
jgi:hypothetical protein